MTPKPLQIDVDWMWDLLSRMLEMPSPAGRTDDIMRMLGAEIADLGLRTRLTRRGALVADLEGAQSSPRRAVVVHADTIGAMVKDLKDNGRLQIVPVGTFSARFAEGARVRIFTDDPDIWYTGTVLALKASGHTYGDEVDSQPTGWPHVEVRIDEHVASAADLKSLGIRVGDFIALEANPVLTPSGFIASRHLDDKAGVAAAMAAFKAVVDAGLDLSVAANLLITVTEEVGQGASHGLDADVAEMLSIDNAVVAPGQQSEETTVNVAMQDQVGPFDYHLTRRLLYLCETHGIPARRDVYTFYRSDVAAAIDSGAEMRAALIGFGVDASHGHERTHIDGVRRVAELTAMYLQTELTFGADSDPIVDVEEFPTQQEAQEVRGYPATSGDDHRQDPDRWRAISSGDGPA